MMIIALSKIRLDLLKMQSSMAMRMKMLRISKGKSRKVNLAASDIANIKEDIDVIRLKRKRDAPLPTYIPSSEKGNARNHSYSTVVDSRKSRKWGLHPKDNIVISSSREFPNIK